MGAEATVIRGAYSLPSRLLLLIAGLTLPVLAFVTFVLLQHAASQQHSYAEQASRLASLVGRIVDDELTRLAALLRGASISGRLEALDFRGFQLEAQHLAAGTDYVVLLRDLDQTQYLNTAVAYGEPLPQAVPISAAEREAFQSGKTVFGSVYKSPLNGEFRVPVAVPVTVGGKLLVLALTVPAAHFGRLLEGAAPPDWIVTIGDATGTIVGRSADNEKYEGQPALPAYLALATGQAGSFHITGFGGRKLLTGYSRSGLSGWLTGANVPVEVVERPLWLSVGGILLAATLSAMAAGGISWAFVRHFRRASATLINYARASDADGPPQGTTGLHEFDQVIEALVAARGQRSTAENLLRQRTRELEVVLDAVPAGVWFTYDPSVREVKRNAQASRLLRLPSDEGASIGSGALAHFQVLRNGTLCSASDLPLQRAFDGEEVADEEYVFRFTDGSEITLLTGAEPLRAADGKVIGAVSVSLDITDRKRSETRQKLLINELNHRVKNTLATVQSIARRTIRNASSLDEADHALSARLVAVGRAYDVLTKEHWEGASIHETLGRALGGYAAGRIALAGDDVRLSPSGSVTISLVVHELAVNATKYGALSNDAGKVEIGWTVREVADGRVLTMTWRESGGPEVRAPSRKGFGTDLLSKLSTSEGVPYSLEFDPAGVVCVFSMYLSDVARAE